MLCTMAKSVIDMDNFEILFLRSGCSRIYIDHNQLVNLGLQYVSKQNHNKISTVLLFCDFVVNHT